MNARPIRIDNQVVRVLGGGICVTPMAMFRRQRPAEVIEIDNMPFITLGNRVADSLLIQRLMDRPELIHLFEVQYPDYSYELK